MNCSELHTLEDYLDGTLPEEECRRFERHLKACASCQQAVEQEKSLQNLIKSQLQLKAPPDFQRRILKGLMAEESPRLVPDWLWASGLGLVVAVIGLLVGKVGNQFVQKVARGIGDLASRTRLMDYFDNLGSLLQSDWLNQLYGGSNVLMLNFVVAGIILCWGLWQMVKALRG